MLGDLQVRSAIRIAKDQRDTQRFRQRIEDEDDSFALGDHLDATLRHRFDMQLLTITKIGVVDVDRRTPPFLLEVVEAVIDFDSLEPRCEGGTSLESLERKKRFQEDLLGEVFGVGCGTGQISAVGEYPAAVAFHQPVKGAQIPLTGSTRELDQLLVTDFLIYIQRLPPVEE